MASALGAVLVYSPCQFSADLTSWTQCLLIPLLLSLRAFPQSPQLRPKGRWPQMDTQQSSLLDA